MAIAQKSISELSQLTSPVNDEDLLIVSHLSSDSYVTRSLSAGTFATKDKLDDKVKVDESNVSTLNVVHIADEDYYQLVVNDSTVSNTVYVMSSENTNMFGERIVNVSEPVDSTDAATKHYVDNAKVAANNYANSQVTSKFWKLSSTISAELTALNGKVDNKVKIDGNTVSTFNVVNINNSDYNDLVVNDSVLSDTLYLVSSD